MKVNRIATAIQFVADPDGRTNGTQASWASSPRPYEGVYFKFEDEGAYLILAPGSPDTGRGGTGVWFEVDDADAAYRELTARGYTFHEPPFAIPPGRLATLPDPDGNLIGFIDNTHGGMP